MNPSTLIMGLCTVLSMFLMYCAANAQSSWGSLNYLTGAGLLIFIAAKTYVRRALFDTENDGRNRRKLFIDLRALKAALLTGYVGKKALNAGLFYIRQSDFLNLSPPQPSKTDKLILDAIRKAETEGRIIWRGADEANPYRQLCQLLERHGYPGIAPDANAPWINRLYTNDGVKAGIKARGIPLHVIY